MRCALQDHATGVNKPTDLRGKRAEYLIDLKMTLRVTSKADRYNRAKIKVIRQKIAQRGRYECKSAYTCPVSDGFIAELQHLLPANEPQAVFSPHAFHTSTMTFLFRWILWIRTMMNK